MPFIQEFCTTGATGADHSVTELLHLSELDGKGEGADPGDEDRRVGQQRRRGQRGEVGAVPEVGADGLQVGAQQRQPHGLS